MADDDAHRRPKHGKQVGAARPPLAAIAPSEPDLDGGRSSVASIDELLGTMDPSLEITDENTTSAPSEPVTLQRVSVKPHLPGSRQSSFPPPPLPLAAPPPRPGGARRPSVPPPLPAGAPPPPRLHAPGAPGSHGGPPPLPASLASASGPEGAVSSSQQRALAHRGSPPPIPAATSRPRAPAPPPLPRSATRGPALELLTARIAARDVADANHVARGRALAESAVLHEIAGDDALAVSQAEAALAESPALPEVRALLRRKLPRGPGDAALRLLAHVDLELPETPEGALRVSLLAERARLLAAAGRLGEAEVAWSYVLAHDPHHPAALRGKEAALAVADPKADASWEAEAEHLGAMADAYADDPATAAWLLVERATILELRLRKNDGARLALKRALTLDPKVGPVRRALVRHVTRHRDTAALVDLLDAEGRLETDPVRAARLELEAATLVMGAAGPSAAEATSRATALLERAASRAPTARQVDLRVLGDLIRLLTASGRGAEAVRHRRARLGLTTGKSARAEELRTLARLAEEAGDHDAAIRDLEASLAEQADAWTLGQLDRLLSAAGRHEPRITLWVTDAARGGRARGAATEADKRVESLLRAATIAERALGRPDEAVRHLRTAWTAQPGHPDVLEGLTRLLMRPSPDAEGTARPRMELYAQAAAVADGAERKIAYLEKVALLAEETLEDFARAAATYDEILELEPDRLGALLGLARNAARTRDDRALHRALLAEARVSTSEPLALARKTRAAAVVAEADPALALSIATAVLQTDPTHLAARALVTSLHETAGRWELVARSLEEVLPYLPEDDAPERQRVLLALADVQEARLRAPREALATLERAREADPRDARVLSAVARALEGLGEPKALRDAYLALASTAPNEDERAGYLVRAGELSELALRDDEAAVQAYEDALLAAPGEAWIIDRLARLRCRVAPDTHAFDAVDASQDPLDAALELVITREDPPRARVLLDAAFAAGKAPFATLRLEERAHRASRDLHGLARALAQQADTLRSTGPKLGALWALADVEDFEVGAGGEAAPYGRILALDPTDPEALSLTIRAGLGAALGGDDIAARSVIEALRTRARLEPFGGYAVTRLVLAHLLEASEGESTDAPEVREARLAEALGHYREVLARDAASVTAAWGQRRLAHRLGRVDEAVQAAEVLAELTTAPPARARHFFEAAELVAGAEDDSGLGDANARRVRAEALLERALGANPDSIAAASALLKLRGTREPTHAFVMALRRALDHASDREAIIFLGTEVAKLARDDLHDLGVATLAMQRVRAVAPEHAQSLLTLSELYLAQRAWPEAVATLESVVAHAADAEPRLTALFALASIYEKVLARPDEHERVLRAALAIEPESPRALRGLVDHLRSKDSVAPEDDERRELSSLLHRLAAAEHEPAKRCDAYLEASDVLARAGDATAAERAIVLAIVASPESARAFARLAAFFRRGGALDAAAYARALQGLISRGRDAGIADARWFAALGQLEIEPLGRLEEGIAHLEWAVQLDASLHETRFELADAYAKTHAYEQAARALTALLHPDPRPLLSLADASLALALLERMLEQLKRTDEAVVVSELRAPLGDLEPTRLEWLRTRALPPLSDDVEPLGRTVLIQDVLPKPGRHVLLEVAAASTGLDAKLLRASLTEMGIHGRDRVGPRSSHALRPVFDHAMAVLGVEDVELVVSSAVDRPRVAIQDEPWVVLPASLEALPSSVQLAAVARLGARILLGTPWLGELREPAIVAWLVAVARQVAPGYGGEAAVSADAAALEGQVAKAIGRRQRKLLEPLAPHLAGGAGKDAGLPDLATFFPALDQCTLRAAFVVTGDLSATVRAFTLEHPESEAARAASAPAGGLASLAALLTNPILGDTARFALTPEAAALRRRAGSTWAR